MPLIEPVLVATEGVITNVEVMRIRQAEASQPLPAGRSTYQMTIGTPVSGVLSQH